MEVLTFVSELLLLSTLVAGFTVPDAQNDPTNLGGFSGKAGHCGVAVSSKDEGNGPGFVPEMLREVAGRGLSWHTDWSAGSVQAGFSPSDYGNVKLVPQFWGPKDYDFAPVSPPLSTVMLGFNEPDLSDLGGSDVAVGDALDLWMRLVVKAQMQGYQKFAAPSIAKALPSKYTGQPGGSEWLPGFLEGCLAWPGCAATVNYLGFHMYEPNCLADWETVLYWNMEVRVGSLKRLMEEYNAKGMRIEGLWLTEFAGRSDESGQCRTRAAQRNWMNNIVPLLNGDPAVVAYSWFSYGEGRSRFFDDDANLWDYTTQTLNELGEAYFTLCYAQPPPLPSKPKSSPLPMVFLAFVAVALAVLLCFTVHTGSGIRLDTSFYPVSDGRRCRE